MFRVVISPEAGKDIEAACLWYELGQAGLGEKLNKELLRAFETIRLSPSAYHPVSRRVRRFLTRRFHYFVFYQTHGDLINIIGIVHSHRHPRVWKAMIRERG